MSVTTKYGLGAVQVDATTIGRITQVGIPTGPQVLGDARSGEEFPRFQAIASQSVSGTFTSEALKQVLDTIPLIGKDIGALAAGFNLFATKHAKGGTRATGAAHRRYRFNDGLLHLGSLTAEHQANAAITGIAVAAYDGTNEPVVPTESVSLPAPPAEEVFSLGKITIGAFVLNQFRSLEIGFGIEVRSEGSESEVWDRFVNIATINPVITIRGIDIEWLKAANIPLTGKVAAHADTTIYLRKRKDGSTFEDDGESVHIKITAAGLAHIDEAFDASGGDAAVASLVLNCKYDGTNDPVVFNTASPIA